MKKLSKMELVKMKISEITVPVNYPRRETPWNDRYLGMSIEKYGQIDPIVVDAKNNLIAGKRRLTQMKRKRYRKVWVIKHKDLKDPVKRYLYSVIESLQKEDLSPIEKALSFRNLMKIFNTSQRGLARMLNVSKSTIGYHLKLLELPKETKKEIHKGTIKPYALEKSLYKKKIKTHEQFKKETDERKFTSVLKRLVFLKEDVAYARFDYDAVYKIKLKVEKILEIIEKRLKKLKNSNHIKKDNKK